MQTTLSHTASKRIFPFSGTARANKWKRANKKAVEPFASADSLLCLAAADAAEDVYNLLIVYYDTLGAASRACNFAPALASLWSTRCESPGDCGEWTVIPKFVHTLTLHAFDTRPTRFGGFLLSLHWELVSIKWAKNKQTKQVAISHSRRAGISFEIQAQFQALCFNSSELLVENAGKIPLPL